MHLLSRFAEEGVEYVLVGGQAVRRNGFVQATEDVDVLVRASRENGERIKRATSFLASAAPARARYRRPAQNQDRLPYREKDVLDKQMLRRIKQGLQGE